jgi:hypothetical protein
MEEISPSPLVGFAYAALQARAVIRLSCGLTVTYIRYSRAMRLEFSHGCGTLPVLRSFHAL